ncbi:MAG: MoxR family ATPase [Lachnospiraceae bacterium]|nr:MoxR family ATPase [Lachnospiraceae bacterium]
MNIQNAKEYIKDTVTIYLKKDEFGDYRIPVVSQRPVFLLGAPGIGKTAIMEQIAAELGIALVSYSMTHHTRQSALGLPVIKEKEYDGDRYSVSEYTMSEIISSIYETMEESGVKEGILFLDEINCVSETLAPSMLQFLQYKVFGKHKVPEGWVIVTAGNPPEFNKSVREFDVVTMDRLKVLEVEADYTTWNKYAKEKGIHGSVLGFLDIHKDYFYHIETTVEGRSYVTARGWEDLSDIISLYEEEGLKVTGALIGQYLRNERIVKEFSAYYDLYVKYMGIYRLEGILRGEPYAQHIEKLKTTGIDEKLTVMGILIDKTKGLIRHVMGEADVLKEIMPSLKNAQNQETIKSLIDAQESIMASKKRAGSLTKDEKNKRRKMKAVYEEILNSFENAEFTGDSSIKGNTETSDNVSLKNVVSSIYNSHVSTLKEEVSEVKSAISHLYGFTAEAFGDESNEMLVLTTELTMSDQAAAFMVTFGSPEYDKYSELLKVTNRNAELQSEIISML